MADLVCEFTHAEGEPFGLRKPDEKLVFIEAEAVVGEGSVEVVFDARLCEHPLAPDALLLGREPAPGRGGSGRRCRHDQQ